MSPTSKKEYTAAIKARYLKATKMDKQIILNEFCSICGYNRKYAIRLLNAKDRPKKLSTTKRGRKAKYTDPMILKVILRIWKLTNLPCSKRMKAILALWLPHYPYLLSDKIYADLLNISPATIDRLMQPLRKRYSKFGLSTTKPGSLLKKHIPVQTDQWDQTVPGYLEADTVAHCGTSLEGMFVYTVNCVDIATGWTEQRAIWGKGERGAMQAVENIENSLPFPILGFDCDNGSEFLNWHLFRHFVERNKPVHFTRARPYNKNDNAHIEEKNWTHVRQYLGYQRFDKIELVELMNDLYTTEWRLYFNFFIPSVKLVDKYRKGSQIIKKFDSPKTPLQRLIESKHIDPQIKFRLQKHFESMNPFALQSTMSDKIKNIQRTLNQN
jgi:hypothetical protein